MRLTVQSRIWGMLLLFVIALIMMAGVHVWSERAAMISEKKLKTRHLVQAVISLLGHYRAQELAGQLSHEQAQEAARQLVKGMRYGETDYFWIQDARAPVMLMHPRQPALTGTRIDIPRFNRATSIQFGVDGPVRMTDGQANMGVAFNAVANEAGRGFVTYAWPRRPGSGGDDQSVLYPKLSYVEKFVPWEWVVGSGIYIDDVDQATRESALRYLAVISLGGALLSLFAVMLANSVIRPLKQSTRRLTAMSLGNEPVGPLPVERQDEIGALVEGYNRLQATLQERDASLRLAASVVGNVLEGIVITDTQRRIISVNAAFTRLTGHAARDVVGHGLDVLCADSAGVDWLLDLWSRLAVAGSWNGEWLCRCRDAHVFVARASIVPVFDADLAIEHCIVVLQDITEQKRLTEQLQEQAHTDSLTGLANRRHFIAQAERELSRLDRHAGDLALAMLDLDHFKQINDSYGHAAGDQVLVRFAAICRTVLREIDIVGRIGGEEFAIVFTRTSGRLAVDIAERLRQEVGAARIVLDSGEAIAFSVSLGITERRPGEADLDALLKRADAALFEAKTQGRNRVCQAATVGA